MIRVLLAFHRFGEVKVSAQTMGRERSIDPAVAVKDVLKRFTPCQGQGEGGLSGVLL